MHIVRNISKRFTINLDAYTYKIYNQFKNVTKNKGLLLEITQKLTLFNIYYEEKFYHKLVRIFGGKYLKNGASVDSKFPKLPKKFDKEKFIIQLIFNLECTAFNT